MSEAVEQANEHDEVAEMDRGDLEAEVTELRARLDELEQKVERNNDKPSRHIVNHLIAAATGCDIDDFSVDPMQHRSALVDLNERLADVENTVDRHDDAVSKLGNGTSSTPDEHWFNTVAAAENLESDPNHGLPRNRVQLFTDNISQATGLSEKMAGNYIEDWGETKQGTTWRPYKPPSSANNGKARRKRLVIDLDVWGDDDD